MATKKQRRRREKEQRHEYEVVYVDEDGEEVAVDEAEYGAPKPRVKAATNAKSGRRARTLDPPSWRRSLRRGLIFAPLFLGMILLLNGGGQSLAYSVANTLVLLLVFVPFSYFLDRLFWRAYQKRLARAGGS